MAFAYLSAARQARLAARASIASADAAVFLRCARFWITQARRAPSPQLP